MKKNKILLETFRFLIGLKSFKRRFKENSFCDTNKLGLHKVFRNNRQEAVHNAIKKFLNKKCHTVEFIKAFKELTDSQQLERLRAILELGEYRVKQNCSSILQYTMVSRIHVAPFSNIQ